MPDPLGGKKSLKILPSVSFNACARGREFSRVIARRIWNSTPSSNEEFRVNLLDSHHHHQPESTHNIHQARRKACRRLREHVWCGVLIGVEEEEAKRQNLG